MIGFQICIKLGDGNHFLQFLGIVLDVSKVGKTVMLRGIERANIRGSITFDREANTLISRIGQPTEVSFPGESCLLKLVSKTGLADSVEIIRIVIGNAEGATPKDTYIVRGARVSNSSVVGSQAVSLCEVINDRGSRIANDLLVAMILFHNYENMVVAWQGRAYLLR